MIRTIFGFLIALIICSCVQQTSKDEPQILQTGLKIECKPTRGQSYTDTLGTRYQLRHIPVAITNDSTMPIHVQIVFSKEYDYPIAYDDEQFKVFPMPKEWALDGVGTTEKMQNELSKYIAQPILNKTLEPGEKWLFAFGTLYPANSNYGVFPVAVFSHDNRALYHECNRLVNPGELTIPPLSLELLIGFTSGSQASPDSCITIPFGQIAYVES